MEYIQALQNLVQDYWVLSLCVGFFQHIYREFYTYATISCINNC